MTTIPATVAALAPITKALPTDRRNCNAVLVDKARGATVATNGHWLIALRTAYADAAALQLHPDHVKAIARATPKRGRHETSAAYLAREVGAVDAASEVTDTWDSSNVQSVARTVAAGVGDHATIAGAPVTWVEKAATFPDYCQVANTVPAEKLTAGPCLDVDYLLAMATAAKAAGATAVRIDLYCDADKARTSPAVLRMFNFSRNAHAGEAHVGDALVMPLRGDSASLPVVGSADYVATIKPKPAEVEPETEPEVELEAADDVERYTLPVYWSTAMVNGDFSGLNATEEAECRAWIEAHPGLDCVDVLDDVAFRHDGGDDGGFPGDRCTFVFLRHDTPAVTVEPADDGREHAAHVMIAADGVETLRRADVFRVLESAAPFLRSGLAEWITARRADLAEEVAASLADLLTDTTDTDTTDTESAAA